MYPNVAAAESADFASFPWMKYAVREFGVCRAHGPADNNPRVLEYLQVVGLAKGKKGDDEAWCSAFANWCMRQAGVRGSMGGLARSWLSWGRMCLAKPVFGAVTVLSRPPDVHKGHVSFFVGLRGDKVLLLGGNQSMREGGMRISSVVSVSEYPRTRVLGYRWPAQASLPNNAAAPAGVFPGMVS